jgi:hypothetical protein
MEANVAPTFSELFNTLKEVALGKQENFDAIIEKLKQITGTMRTARDPGFGYEYGEKLAEMVCSVMRSDTVAEYTEGVTWMGGKSFKRTYNSLISRIIGPDRFGKIWEWNPADERKFLEACANADIIRRQPYDYNGDVEAPKIWTIKLPFMKKPIEIVTPKWLEQYPNVFTRSGAPASLKRIKDELANASDWDAIVYTILRFAPLAVAVGLVMLVKAAFDKENKDVNEDD